MRKKKQEKRTPKKCTYYRKLDWLHFSNYAVELKKNTEDVATYTLFHGTDELMSVSENQFTRPFHETNGKLSID